MTPFLSHLVFALGGGLGAISRHFLTKTVTHRFPISTLLVNILGSLILGIGVGALGDSIPQEGHRLLLGFCGGFTTFSSFAHQSLNLHREETLWHAAVNIATSLTLCLLAYGAGIVLSTRTWV